jgi:hypothetical protein
MGDDATDADVRTLPIHRDEPHADGGAGRLNWPRAGVLGANDGIVSVAGIVVGVAGATVARGVLFTAGLAGLVVGAVSMALGEYVSVSSQRDTEHALMAQEHRELHESPEAELAELTALYREKGLSEATARRVAEELTLTTPWVRTSTPSWASTRMIWPARARPPSPPPSPSPWARCCP